MKYYSEVYDSQYQTLQSKKENEEIRSILLNLKGSVLDLGCGTGLAYNLARFDKYTGIDINDDMIKHCNSCYDKEFLFSDAYSYISTCKSFDNIISLFSINYMNPEIIDEIVKKAKDKVLIIHYNKPYLYGSTSYYTNKKYEYLDEHKINNMSLKWILDRNDFTTTKFLSKDFYWLSLLEK